MSTRDERQRSLERMYAQWFLGQTESRGRLVDSLHPDFLVDGLEKATGIEVTSVYVDEHQDGSTAKAGERKRARFLAECAKQYYEDGGRPILVKAALSESPTVQLRHAIVRRLLEVQTRLPNLNAARYELASARCVLHITALPEEAGPYSRWVCLDDLIGWVGRLDAEVLTAKTRQKSAKPPLYRRVVDHVILLVVADRTRNSGRLAWTDRAGTVDGAGFDEVHLAIYPEAVHRVA